MYGVQVLQQVVLLFLQHLRQRIQLLVDVGETIILLVVALVLHT